MRRLTDDTNVVASLRRVAVACHELVPNSRAASLTVIASRTPLTVAASDDVASTLDATQYRAGVGPALTAARTEHVIRIQDLAADERWPELRRAGLARGIASSLSMPLRLQADHTFGALNVYGDHPRGFDAGDEGTLAGLAAHATVVVANLMAYWEAIELAHDLSTVIVHRGTVEQAKGILMARHHLSPDDAFGLLRQRSQHEDRTLHDVAIDIVRDTQLGGPPG